MKSHQDVSDDNVLKQRVFDGGCWSSAVESRPAMSSHELMTSGGGLDFDSESREGKNDFMRVVRQPITFNHILAMTWIRGISGVLTTIAKVPQSDDLSLLLRFVSPMVACSPATPQQAQSVMSQRRRHILAKIS
ncbi:hypothetical protein L1887_15137 [Cichorium endivia]|nr:hypothetical protein L1887_15137 [Cichorium endivia]